jgi:hypothetical protein
MNNSEVTNCSSGTGIIQQGGRVHIDKCKIAHNENGISVTSNLSHFEINNSTITANTNGITCNASTKTIFHVQRCTVSENTSSALFIESMPEVLKVFDNSIINNKDTAIKVGPAHVSDKKLQECVIDNIVQNNAGEEVKPLDKELVTQLAVPTELSYSVLDIETVIQILQFVTFPLGQCLMYLRSEWLESSDEVYDHREGFIFRSLYGYKKLAHSTTAFRTEVYLLYTSLDMSICEEIDLFIPFNNGLIPTKKVHSLQLNETWIEKNQLRMIELTKRSLRCVNLSHCSNLTEEVLQELYSWIESCDSSVHLDLTGASVPLELLSHLHNVSVLKLRPTSITESDTSHALTNFMEQCGEQLQNLELSYYPLGTKGAETVFQHVKNCQRICLMGVEIGKSATDDMYLMEDEEYEPEQEDVSSLFYVLQENNSVLTHLNIKDNVIGDESVLALSGFPSLRNLNLEECSISSDGLQLLLTNNRSIESLNVAVNSIGDEGLDPDLLLGNTTLKVLNLSFNSQITSAAFMNLSLNRSIHTLIIHGCAGQCTDEVVQSLCSMPNLSTLHVSGNELTHMALLNITISKITHLDISYNFVGDEGAIIIAKHTILKSLNMSSNKVTFLGARELFGSKCIEFLDLSQNIDIQDSFISTFEALQNNTVLKHLVLANIENISQHKTLEVLLTKNKTLESINLQGTNVSGEYLRMLLQQKLTINPNLRSLSLSDEDGPDLGQVTARIFVS